MPSGAPIPVVITAGGRLPEEFAARAGTVVKALVSLGGRPLIWRVRDALAAVEGVAPNPIVVGPVEDLQSALGGFVAEWVPEGKTGPDNVVRGLAVLSQEAKAGGAVLLSTSDLAFPTPEAIHWLLRSAPEDAEIVYPVIRKETFEAAFPGSPNTYAKLAGQEYTGGSILLVRPDAIARNLPLIQRVFEARKSQFEMARLLGIGFLISFLTGRLTVEQAERRASELTGCRCKALMDAPPEIGADIDSLADYEWAESFLRSRAGTTEVRVTSSV